MGQSLRFKVQFQGRTRFTLETKFPHRTREPRAPVRGSELTAAAPRGSRAVNPGGGVRGGRTRLGEVGAFGVLVV